MAKYVGSVHLVIFLSMLAHFRVDGKYNKIITTNMAKGIAHKWVMERCPGEESRFLDENLIEVKQHDGRKYTVGDYHVTDYYRKQRERERAQEIQKAAPAVLLEDPLERQPVGGEPEEVESVPGLIGTGQARALLTLRAPALSVGVKLPGRRESVPDLRTAEQLEIELDHGVDTNRPPRTLPIRGSLRSLLQDTEEGIATTEARDPAAPSDDGKEPAPVKTVTATELKVRMEERFKAKLDYERQLRNNLTAVSNWARENDYMEYFLAAKMIEETCVSPSNNDRGPHMLRNEMPEVIFDYMLFIHSRMGGCEPKHCSTVLSPPPPSPPPFLPP
eukprot:CAMPEP_0114226974 /NCGR_PEP_ID=MMETSP0058-20121206/1532_1 /TAXON_ID=36894 /ORGANISM="Pyramimonas parkeae, CCMP726" /LENGTH=331 /DNA_ID=CAMNT_0001337763 /DNA_START=180 /DNA_END=1171 /DNA_ORIENTATION=+